MVSIVIVSHSPDLAKGIHALAVQMTQGKVPISTAAGVDDEENPLGTDAIAIMSAIEEVYSPDGVIIFVDMGSAMLSTDMALELLDPDMVEKISVCAAPIVEGVISASVAAMSGQNTAQIIAQAHQALVAKYELLNQSEFLLGNSTLLDDETSSETQEQAVTQEFVIKNPHGLHARPAAAIIAAVSPFDADITIRCEDKKANAKSINSIALLGVKRGDIIQVTASGNEAQQALDEFSVLYQQNFLDELDQEPQVSVSRQTRERRSDSEILGVSVCGGVASAPVFHYQRLFEKPSERAYTSFNGEFQLFVQARLLVIQDITHYAQLLSEQHLIAESEIFQAHAQMLEDPELDAELHAYLKEEINVEKAWSLVVDDLIALYQASASEYMQARVKDVRDIGQQILCVLKGHKIPPISFAKPIIWVGEDLLPSQVVQCNAQWVKGIAIEASETNSHSAIIAKALGIPMIVAAKSVMQLSTSGEMATINGDDGSILLEPTSA